MWILHVSLAELSLLHEDYERLEMDVKKQSDLKGGCHSKEKGNTGKNGYSNRLHISLLLNYSIESGCELCDVTLVSLLKPNIQIHLVYIDGSKGYEERFNM